MTTTPSPDDPSGFVTSPPSTIVKIQGTAREDINGQLGIVVQFAEDRGRYLVHLTQTQNVVAMKPENLTKANYLEQAQAYYQQICKQPEFQRFLTQIQSKLPAGMTLKHAGMAVGALLVSMIYFLGFSRTMMLMSFTMLVLMVVGPDIVAGADPPTILRNAPNRFKTMVRDQFPGGSYIADKPYALAAVAALMVFFFVKSMMPVKKAAATAAATMANPGVPSRNLMSAKTIEEYYKMGFDDATAQREYGTSLPDLSQTTPSNIVEDDPLDDLPDYPMPPPTNNKSMMSKFLSMSNAMSIMYLGQTALALGRDADGSWSFELFRANATTLEPWKLGLLGMSLFKLVTSLVT